MEILEQEPIYLLFVKYNTVMLSPPYISCFQAFWADVLETQATHAPKDITYEWEDIAVMYSGNIIVGLRLTSASPFRLSPHPLPVSLT